MSFIQSTLLSGLVLAVALCTGCSNHVYPAAPDIQQALAERGTNVSDVEIGKCVRHNGVDQGNDPHFDWYACEYRANVGGTVKTLFGTFMNSSDGWHTE